MIDDTLRQVRAAEIQQMSHDQKVRYLKTKGWHRAQGNRWQSRNGMTASFGAAVTTELLADLDGSP